MSVYDLLTERDKDLITEYIGAFADHTQDVTYDWRGLDVVLNEWNRQKSKGLETLFDEQLILRRPFTYKMPVEGIRREFTRLANKQILFDTRKWLNTIYYNNVDSYTLPSDVFSVSIMQVLSDETLINNAYQGEPFIINLPPRKTVKITKGMKPMRIIHTLAEIFDPAYLEPDPMTNKSAFDEFCIWHSQIFNQANIDGELCLSIHPLDFMTMSDNSNNWDSCMTWTRYDNPGDYRAGTVECMNSPYIIVAYLHNPKHTMTKKNIRNSYNNVCDDWEWNSKRWRELFIVQEGVIMEIKGYPYQDENLTNACLMWLKELAHNIGWDYNDEELNTQDSIDVDDENYYSVTPETTYHMYNDVGTLPVHRMRVNYEKLKARCEKNSGYCNSNSNENFYETCYQDRDEKKRWHHIYTIPYGGYASCMCCGGWLDDDEERSDKVLCESCMPGFKCACCGEWITSHPYFISNSDDPICEYCAENNTVTDELSDDVYLEGDSSLVTVHWAPVVDDNGEVIIDESYDPYFYDRSFITYDPNYSREFKALFDGRLKEYNKPGPYGWTTSYFYVTNDMIKDKTWFYNLFYIDGDKEFNKIIEGTKRDIANKVEAYIY